jgi:hypothetical protein
LFQELVDLGVALFLPFPPLVVDYDGWGRWGLGHKRSGSHGGQWCRSGFGSLRFQLHPQDRD